MIAKTLLSPRRSIEQVIRKKLNIETTGVKTKLLGLKRKERQVLSKDKNIKSNNKLENLICNTFKSYDFKDKFIHDPQESSI